MSKQTDQPGKLAWLAIIVWLLTCGGLMWAFNPITPMDLAGVCAQIIQR
jgi:hypothetical protein